MRRLSEQLRRNIQHGTAKADTWVAVAALFLAGWSAAHDDWIWSIVAGIVGLVFLISSGSYCWRKGFVAAKRTVE